MKAFLVTVSSLCLCGILLCFFAYAKGIFPSSKTTKDTPASISSQQAGTGATDPLCSPCAERTAMFLEMVQEWEAETIKTPALAAAKVVEADGWEGLSSEQRKQAKQLFDQYGTEEGLRRLRASDPDAAERFDRDAPKRDGYSDESPPDDVPESP